MKKMNQQEFMNILCILAKMDERCADRIIKSTQQSFIEVKSASDFTKQYEPVCVDDLYFNYMFDRVDVPQAVEEVINRITKAKQVVMKNVQEEQKVIGIDGNHVLDILDRIMHDADNMPPEEPEESEEPEKPEEPATPVVQPVLTKPVMSKKESSFDDMLSALEDEDEEEVGNTSTAPEHNDSKKPDTSDDLYNAFDDEDSDLLSALEEEEDGIAEQNPAESDNDETEEQPEETQEEAPEETQEEEPEETQKEQSDGLSLDESNGEPDDSVNLCSPSLSVSESGNEELCSELSPDVDGVSGSTYTSSNHQTDGQPEVGRGLPSIDDIEEGQEKESVAVDIEQEMKDAFAKILNFKYRPSSSEEEEAKEIFDTLVKGASRNFFAKPASIQYDVKEEAKKPVNPNGNVSLGDVIAAALGMPEAGKLDTDTGDTGDDFDL